MSETIIIPINRKKIILGTIGACFMVLLAGWLLTSVADVQTRFNPFLIKTAAILGIACFGPIGFLGFQRLFSGYRGIVIDNTGILDETGSKTFGLVTWNDVTEFKSEEVMSSKFILIGTDVPDKYLNRITKGMKAKLMQSHMRLYATPLSISLNLLKTDAPTLLATLEKAKERFS